MMGIHRFDSILVAQYHDVLSNDGIWNVNKKLDVFETKSNKWIFTSTGTLASFQAQDLNSSNDSFSRMHNNLAHKCQHQFVGMTHKWIYIVRKTIYCLSLPELLAELYRLFWLHYSHMLNVVIGHIRYMNLMLQDYQAVLLMQFQGIQHMTVK